MTTDADRSRRGNSVLRFFWLAGLCHLVTLSPCHLVTLRADEPAAPVFRLQTAEGPALTGRLERLDAGWSVRLGGRQVDGGNVVALRRDGTPPPDFPGGEQLLFVNGDRLAGHVTALGGERLQARLPVLGGERPASLPLSALSVIWLGTPDSTDDPALLRRRLATGRRDRDTVLLRNGDILEGVLSGLDEKAVQIEVDRKPVSVARAKAAAVALSTDLAAALRPRGVYARLVLADGSRVSLASAVCTDGAAVTGTTLFDAPVRVPLTQVVALALYQGRAVYLSDLKPRRSEQTPFLDLAWPLVNDGSADRRDLRLGGGTYDKGLGMHSAARVTYDLDGRYRRFEALVGLDDQAGDDQAGRQGSVRVRVLVDGQERSIGRDRDLTARDGPVPVRADVAGARELTLVIDFGDRGDVQDRVDWVDARLVK